MPILLAVQSRSKAHGTCPGSCAQRNVRRHSGQPSPGPSLTPISQLPGRLTCDQLSERPAKQRRRVQRETRPEDQSQGSSGHPGNAGDKRCAPPVRRGVPTCACARRRTLARRPAAASAAPAARTGSGGSEDRGWVAACHVAVHCRRRRLPPPPLPAAAATGPEACAPVLLCSRPVLRVLRRFCLHLQPRGGGQRAAAGQGPAASKRQVDAHLREHCGVPGATSFVFCIPFLSARLTQGCCTRLCAEG